MYTESHPFLAPPDESEGTGMDGLGSTVSPGQVSADSNAVVPAEDRMLPHPTRVGQGAQIEGLTEGSQGDEETSDEAAESANGTAGDASIPEDVLSPGTSLEDLPIALQDQIKQARTELDDVRRSLPSQDVLRQNALEAAGFQRIVGSDAFRRFLDANPGEFGDGTAEGIKNTPAVASSNDPAMQQMLENFDEGQIATVQRMIDNAVNEKVTPVAESYYADKAKQTLAGLVTKYGEKTWTTYEPAILQAMQREGVSAEFAAKAIIGESALNQATKAQQDTLLRKKRTSVMGGGATPAVSEPTSPRKTPRTIRAAVEQAEVMFEEGTAWKPR